MKQILKQVRAVGALVLLAAGLLSAACEGSADPAWDLANVVGNAR